jgi:hypothetical protein
MPAKSHNWLERIRAVEREFLVARLAIERLLAAVRYDPALLGQEIAPRDIPRAARNLEGTYILRLFAEFESGLRDFWSAKRSTEPPARTRDLLDGIAAAQSVHAGELEAAHAAREYRNSLIHERDTSLPAIPLSQVRRSLCRFFAFLPPDW